MTAQQIFTYCGGACSSADALFTTVEMCCPSCSRMKVPWSWVGEIFGLKRRSEWSDAITELLFNFQQYRQILANSAFAASYLLLQLVVMGFEATTGTRRKDNVAVTTIVCSIIVVIIMASDLISPTSTSFIRVASNIGGIVIGVLAAHYTSTHSMSPLEFSALCILLVINGAGMMSTSIVAKAICNLMFGVVVVAYWNLGSGAGSRHADLLRLDVVYSISNA